MEWSYGITTVPSRANSYLPRTIESLRRAGFSEPRLFVDGWGSSDSYEVGFQVEATARKPAVGVVGNFHLGLLELLMRNPACDRFAMFQDDILACRDLKTYLSRCKYPKNGYWNLFSFLNNDQEVCGRTGWMEGHVMQSDPTERLQSGRGALGYVFSREAVVLLLSSPYLVGKHIAASGHRTRCLDGAVITAFNMARSKETPFGWREYVHGPSLVQHHGRHTSLGTGKDWSLPDGEVKGSKNWRGEDWSAMELLQ